MSAPAIDLGPARGGARLSIVNPATGAPMRDVAEDAPEAVARKFARAARGQKEWARVRIDDRTSRLARFGQLAQERDGLVVDRLVGLATVAVLHDRHPGSGVVEELAPGALEDGQRQGSGTSVEIRDSHGRGA